MTKSNYTKFMLLCSTLFITMTVLSIVFFNPIFIAVAVNTGGIIFLTTMVYRKRLQASQAAPQSS